MKELVCVAISVPIGILLYLLGVPEPIPTIAVGVVAAVAAMNLEVK